MVVIIFKVKLITFSQIIVKNDFEIKMYFLKNTDNANTNGWHVELHHRNSQHAKFLSWHVWLKESFKNKPSTAHYQYEW